MKYVKIVEKVKYPHVNGEEWKTTHLMKTVVTKGKIFNQGLNVLNGSKILQACDDAILTSKKYVAIEDADYDMFMNALKSMDWQSYGVDGFGYFFVEDIKSIQNPLDQIEEE